MEQKEQTAVEWLLLNLEVPFPKINEYKLIIELAKQMEKQQRKQSYDNGYANGQLDLITE